MWRDVARLLAGDHTVICVDLRGYGRSGVPASLRIITLTQRGPWRMSL